MIPTSRLAELLGRSVVRVSPIGGGAAGRVFRAHLADGGTAVIKEGANLDVEARSLAVLAERSALPVPRVVHAEPSMLIMTDLGDGGRITRDAERRAAELLADLHGRTSAGGRFGLEFDNFIGPLEQRNGWCDSWVEFYRERRLLDMADAAVREGVLPSRSRGRLGLLAARLGELIPDRPPASLIHGDVWSGNVISRPDSRDPAGEVGFIDPAPHYAHAEVELAFITMFGTLGSSFFERYSELRGVDREFWSLRRPVYLLYPLLTHVRIYRGGGYVEQLDAALAELGF